MQSIDLTGPLLKEVKNIVITTHYGPDGDAIGSSLGLALFLAQQGHHITTIIPSKCPDFLDFLPAVDQLINFEAEPQKTQKAIHEAELIFCLDFNTMSRTRDLAPLLLEATATKILIDHHLFPEKSQFDFGWSHPEASSTCEMIYDYIIQLKGKERINMDIMTLLYTGVVTDTGSFRFERASSHLHQMVSFFKEKGLEHTWIHEQLFNTWSEERLRFLGHVLSERLQTIPHSGWSFMAVPDSDFKKFNVKKEDLEGFVNYGLSIKGIHSTVLLSERGDQEVRLSFRSNIGYDVRTIAANYFNGGGHENAAGGIFKGSLEEAIQHFKLNIIK